MTIYHPGIYKNILVLVIQFAGFGLFSCSSPTDKLTRYKHLNSFPSGSALMQYNDKTYLVGDNASYMLVLNKDLQVTDSITIISAPSGEIPKTTKPDFEAMTLIETPMGAQLLILGSGSVIPYREQGILVAVGSMNKMQTISLHSFYSRLKKMGIPELNIEGAATVLHHVVLANRGSQGNPTNQLIVTDPEFFAQPGSAFCHIIQMEIPGREGVFSGISGLEYAPLNGQLLMTVSTEDTRNSYEDGAIGKSYLMVINDFAKKQAQPSLQPDKIIDLGHLNKLFVGQKIESVTLLRETAEFMDVMLAADNDIGDSWIFEVRIFL